MPNGMRSVSPWTTSTFSIGDAELLGDDLRERGLVALAVAVRAGEDASREPVGWTRTLAAS